MVVRDGRLASPDNPAPLADSPALPSNAMPPANGSTTDNPILPPSDASAPAHGRGTSPSTRPPMAIPIPNPTTPPTPRPHGHSAAPDAMDTPQPAQRATTAAIPINPTEPPVPPMIIQTGNATPTYGRQRKAPVGMYLAIAAALAAITLIAFAVYRSRTTQPPFSLAQISDTRCEEHQSVTIPLTVHRGGRTGLSYALVEAPSTATIDESGTIRWTPDESSGGETARFVAAVRSDAEEATTAFSVHVAEHNARPMVAPIEEKHLDVGDTLDVQVMATDEDVPAQKLHYSLASGHPDGVTIDQESGRVQWTPSADFNNRRLAIDVKVSDSANHEKQATGRIIVRIGSGAVAKETQVTGIEEYAAKMRERRGMEPVAPQDGDEPTDSSTSNIDSMSMPQPTNPQPVAESLPGGAAFDAIAQAHQLKTLFNEPSYYLLRKYFASQREQECKTAIESATGDEASEMIAWLDAHPDIKEELYTAVDPEHDDLIGVFRIFNQIRLAHPEKLASYGNLAIACALVWDQPQGAVYDYTNHANRCKATIPSQTIEAADNFSYFITAENFMQGRGQFLPWEFLIHVVNHRTPFPEREWAMRNYVTKRTRFGTCYGDVPYDHEMLNSKSEIARMNGKDYTLPNLKKFGGVCAMQADFAARVGKSLGVPAAYVAGENRYGGLHAWVMWVELINVSSKSIVFQLESHGRYRGDKYYVGNLKDPQTGQPITDRQLELRLHVAGTDTLKKRHADLLMQALPILEEREHGNIDDHLEYLGSVTNLSPGNESAWRALAELADTPELQEGKRYKQMVQRVDQFLLTFSKFPDFTWEIFDQLVSFETDFERRMQFFDRIAFLYAKADRPDLACKARMHWADMLIAQGKQPLALKGLGLTIEAFPNEGRYVPEMFDKLEQASEGIPDAKEQLLAFYASFLPKIDKYRNNRPSEYCIAMYQRVIDHLNQANLLQAAALYQAQLEQIKAGKP